MEVRGATNDDLAAIVELTTARRARLAAWEPQFWRAAAGADELHPMWLGFLIGGDAPTRVVCDGDDVCGFAVSVDQGDQWFVDDLAVDDARWDDAGAGLLDAITERPALLCVPALDHLTAGAARAAGYSVVSGYWYTPIGTGDSAGTGGATSTTVEQPFPETGAPPAHTMRLPAGVEWLHLRSDVGSALVSPSAPAPPIYDPGGTTCVVERVVGTDRTAMLAAVAGFARARGDVQLVTVCDSSDSALRDVLDASGWRRIVDVHRRD